MALLSFTDLSLTFQRGRRHVVNVLADVSLAVEPGEVVTVIARRAQGKTSLLRLAAGMQRPNRGRVCFAGQDVWELPPRTRARLLTSQIGWAANAAPELDVPMLTSVALPMLGRWEKREAYARAGAALERLGIANCAEQRWGSLADWERALAVLAHGIAREPRLLLVDDLTSSLGLGEVDDAMCLLGSLAQEREMAVLMCVSEAKATAWSQRVLTLAGGELLEPAASPSGGENVIDFPTNTTRRLSL